MSKPVILLASAYPNDDSLPAVNHEIKELEKILCGISTAVSVITRWKVSIDQLIDEIEAIKENVKIIHYAGHA